MAIRPTTKTLTSVPAEEEPVDGTLRQRKRPETGRYLLQVDRQTKGSYASAEAAETAGLVIKKRHPVVRVTVYDSVDCNSKLIETVDATANGA